MRFSAPVRAEVDPAVFANPPLSLWREYDAFLRGHEWPDLAALNAHAHSHRFVVQTPGLLRDGLHYERRIAERGQIATRERNWHDLLNALVWLRFPQIKAALNARQVEEIDKAGPKRRTRAQCALTHFDEGGAIVLLQDPHLLSLWDAHDWHALFWHERAAWRDGRIEVLVFGHALLEHALRPEQLLVGKTLVVAMPRSGAVDGAIHAVADAIRLGELLNDPQELRPLPLSGIPGWHAQSDDDVFYRDAPCFRPLRAGRRYPAALDPHVWIYLGLHYNA